MLWPRCVSGRPTQSITNVCRNVCKRWTHLASLDLALCGMHSTTLVSFLENMSLPCLREFKLRIGGTMSQDLQDPVPVLPCPTDARLQTLHLSLGHRVHAGGLKYRGLLSVLVQQPIWQWRL